MKKLFKLFLSALVVSLISLPVSTFATCGEEDENGTCAGEEVKIMDTGIEIPEGEEVVATPELAEQNAAVPTLYNKEIAESAVNESEENEVSTSFYEMFKSFFFKFFN